MTTITSTVPAPPEPESGSGSGSTVDLDPLQVLQATADCVFAQLRSGAALLEAAVRWADLNPVTEQAPCAADWWDGEGVPVPDHIPEVAAPAVVEFAAAAALSSGAGKWLIFEALQLRHRMPRTWVLVQQCRMPAFRARQLVAACYRLNEEAVAWLDGQTAAVAGQIGPAQVERMVAHAAAVFDPDVLTDQKQKRYVRVDHRHPDSGLDGSTVHGCLDPLDAIDLDAALNAGAEAQKAWGSTQDHDGRRAQALGDLARTRLGETPLPLDDNDPTDDDPAGDDPTSDDASGDDQADVPNDGDDPVGNDAPARGSGANLNPEPDRDARRVPPLVSRPRELTLYVHLSDLALHTSTGTSSGVGTGNGTGTGTGTGTGDGEDQVWLGEFGTTGQPITADLVRQWCGNPDTTVIIKQVIDLRAPIVTEVYRPTVKQREHLALTDPVCAFPHCTRPVHPVPVRRNTDNTLDDSWDADHTTAWHHGDSTSTDGLAGLCRQHHRSKTLHGWRYRRLAPGLIQWRNRHGLDYLRSPAGTTNLGHHTTTHNRTIPGWLEDVPLRPPVDEPPPDPADNDRRPDDVPDPDPHPPPGRPPNLGGGQDQGTGQDQLPADTS